MKWRSLSESEAPGAFSSLRELYAERRALMARYVPQDVQAVHARVVSDLKETPRPELQPGMKAPAFELPDHRGQLVRSSELLASTRLVVLFYRGRWCPFCVGQLEAMNAVDEDIQRLGARLVAISPQTMHQSALMADQHRLRFPLLSDGGNRVARQFGLAYRVPEDQQRIYQRAFINLPFVNGDPAWELPIPATYVLEGDHQILYAAQNPDYTERPEPSDVLRLLSELARKAG